MLHARGKLEAVYEDLLAEMSALLDPQDGNPWPHHTTISGATLAVTRRAYLSVGGMPRVPLGEDKAFVAELRRRDARIRFAPDVQVVTSGRTAGRAPGGVADTLRLRSAAPDALCDEALEPCTAAYRRALWRGRLRRRGRFRRRASTGFGEAWERIEATNPMLARRALAPAELPRQIELATRALRRLQARLAALEDVEPVAGEALSFDDLDEIR
jgi:GT2 family glycosyltransferase